MKPVKTLITNIEDNKELVNFLNLFLVIKEVKLLKDFNNSDYFELDYIAVLSGDNPVNPKKYGQKIIPNITIYEDYRLEFKFLRDLHKLDLEIPVIGIGYGAHILTIFNNGQIIQNINNHFDTHTCHYYGDFRELRVFYTYDGHTQMMLPSNNKNDNKTQKLIAWSKKFLSTTYQDGNEEEIILPDKFLEPEIVKYNNQLAIQSHVEKDFNKNMENTDKIISIIRKNLKFNK